MNDIGILDTLAEVAVSLLGFTGVVVVLNPDRAWHLQEEGRLRNLLECAAVALVCTVLPFLLRAFSVSEALLWRVSNGVLGVASLLIALLLIVRYRAIVRTEDRDLAGPLVFFVICSSTVVIALAQLADAALGWLPSGWPLYLTGLVWLMLLSLLNFIALLVLRRR